MTVFTSLQMLSAIFNYLLWNILSVAVSPKKKKKTEVCNYIIDEILEANDDYVEYLCHSKFFQDKKHKIRDYALDKEGLSPMQLDRHNKLVHNAEMSEELLPASPLIIKKSLPDQ